MPPKKPSSAPWILCEKCGANLLPKSHKEHSEDCPPSLDKPSHNFILNNTLYGSLELKENDEIQGLSQEERDNLVFLSQAAIQLCDLVIGECCIIQDLQEKVGCARTVWPTVEKSATSILLSKKGLELSFEKPNINVKLSKIQAPVKDARKILVSSLTNMKNIELAGEIKIRLQKTYLGRLVTSKNKIGVLFYGKFMKFQIESIENLHEESIEKELETLNIENGISFSKITDKTQWILYNSPEEYIKENSPEINPLEKLGGLNQQIEEIQRLIDISLGKSPMITKYRCKCVLLHGASGTGKTTLAQALAKNNNTNIIDINMTTLYSKINGDTPEESMDKLIEDSIAYEPTIVIIDEIDLLCPLKSNKNNDFDKRMISKLTNFFDTINGEEKQIFVLATTNKLDSIDGSFRRYGRIDREIEIPTPTSKLRLEILETLLKNVPHTLSNEELIAITGPAHGFVGSDLIALCSMATTNAHKRLGNSLEYSDFKSALKQVNPSAMREVQIEVPNIRWSDVGGQEKLKLILKQSVEWPLKHPESFKRMGIEPPRGVLMFGPPGCSKTMIAKALATESSLNFLSIKGPELFNKWVGESERAVREIFRKARQVAPSVIFFDEIDALGGERGSGQGAASVQERVLAQLLTELDGVTALGDVTVLAATNRPDRIDKALLRPGRLDRIVYVPLPDRGTRREIFKLKLDKMPVRGIDSEELVAKTEGFSGAEINAICHEAAMKALEEDLNAECVEERHFQEAFTIVTPRTPVSLIKIYEDYVKK